MGSDPGNPKNPVFAWHHKIDFAPVNPFVPVFLGQLVYETLSFLNLLQYLLSSEQLYLDVDNIGE